ncbi:phospholipase C [Robbsia andropogonis]|uniref:phospholipase C n=1 Tax=Robbsia andropogonis TaxID=28092 RepID=A0A0F5K4I9_9BURK|nr:phospholipase C, phosphocholine-specific [Robbsia andropogonis]KKB65016.1 phospholipase C [Robbsia andropogonis]MCP1118582.1 phospholipase C, phosphocholine-specific [Robbsia andropogonis]MCP1128049.1 phospholipase C, phosphocholine-specific [Robbsia andropogonis]
MKSYTRRDFIRMTMQAGGVAGALGAFPPGLRQALALPANNRTGTLRDVEHIVVLMQENRSFDHYFGTLRGVRGYGDPRAITLPNGKKVWHQPGLAGVGEVLPFRPDVPDVGLTFLQDLPHDWTTTHNAWNNGRYDQWVANKGTTTMAYMRRDDIPYHYALADAFTICDAYHCSIMAATDPNRYYMWTGYVGNDGVGGGPVVDNSEAGYNWSTFPEMLESAGVSWKIYQDVGTGLDKAGSWGWTKDAFIGNYGDNSLLYFTQYQNAQPGTPLYQKARTGTNATKGDGYFDILKRDVENGGLPQVSWIVAPEAFSEHPNWPANYGAWFIDQVLQVLTANPDVWSKTVLLINYDENDGFFDHVAPPSPPTDSVHGASTVSLDNELFAGNGTYAAGPYGLGPRVPMLVVSPWSKGGYVCSQLFDHTSVIRFIAKRFGESGNLHSPNISAWRRAICGDLTSAFDFRTPNLARAPLPSTAAYVPADKQRHADFVPVVPLDQHVPKQEEGVRRARALPYELTAHVRGEGGRASTLGIALHNTGGQGAVLQCYLNDGVSAPSSYTVGAGQKLQADIALNAAGEYDASFVGPNGFWRHFRGSVPNGAGVTATHAGHATAVPEVHEHFEGDAIVLKLDNAGKGSCSFIIVSRRVQHGRAIEDTQTQRLNGGDSTRLRIDLSDQHGWYDVIVTVADDKAFIRHLAGHLENGQESWSDPALGV